MVAAAVALALAVGVALASGEDPGRVPAGAERFVVVPPGAVPGGRAEPRTANALYDLGHGRVAAEARDFGDGVVQKHVEIQVIR
jgi:hypothetical protein